MIIYEYQNLNKFQSQSIGYLKEEINWHSCEQIAMANGYVNADYSELK
jgi:predicted  nucleic acid-binding Zn ribbon protein